MIDAIAKIRLGIRVGKGVAASAGRKFPLQVFVLKRGPKMFAKIISKSEIAFCEGMIRSAYMGMVRVWVTFTEIMAPLDTATSSIVELKRCHAANT